MVGALAGGVLGLLAGFLLYRVTVGATFGLALGGAVALVAVAVLNSPLAERFAQSSSTSTDNRPGHALVGPPSGVDVPTPAVRLTTTGREAAEFRERSSDFLQSLRYAAEFAWEDIPPARRWWVIGAGSAAAIAGALMGIALPTWAAGLVTALVGAAIWLPAAVWLARAADAPGIDALATLPPTGWAIAWLATASVGLGLQWMGLIKSPAKPAATAPAE